MLELESGDIEVLEVDIEDREVKGFTFTINEDDGIIVSGLIGGLPVTQVIVRSSANINFGGKTKMSAILHGVFLLMVCLKILQHLLLLLITHLILLFLYYPFQHF